MMECDKNNVTENAKHVFFCSRVSLYSKISVEFAFLTRNTTWSIRLSPSQ